MTGEAARRDVRAAPELPGVPEGTQGSGGTRGVREAAVTRELTGSDGAPEAALERRLVVTEEAGLHARPAAAFAQAAGRGAATVTVRRAAARPGADDLHTSLRTPLRTSEG
ncbi:HPr family phosphocarrier protein [Streptomyces sp. NPDC091266]|uniref:HPr family phosphocarrier protein n=1 Tax=Streptomyces sp. NPDC091266 TaxID=3365978 RepID=UPI00382B816A